MCAVGHLLVSHAAFSAKLREKLQDMNPAMRRICSYEYWIEGTYLITETRASSDEAGESSEGDVGDDTIVAVNLNGRCDVSEFIQGESRLFEIVGGQSRVRLRQEFEEGNDDDDDNDDDNDDDGKRPQPIFRGVCRDEVSANTGNERAFDDHVRELLQRTVGYSKANINLQPRVRREELEASVLVALLRKRGVHGRTGVDQSCWAGQHAAILEEPV